LNNEFHGQHNVPLIHGLSLVDGLPKFSFLSIQALVGPSRSQA
jgi:hypothetical protein